MEDFPFYSASRFISCFFVFLICFTPPAKAAQPAHQLVRGFEAKPDSSVVSFQSLLTDPDGNFSFGFLRVNRTRLSLAVIHPNLSNSIWIFDPTRSATWSVKTRLYFNGSLVISDPSSGVEWSTGSDGDRVVLRNDSNLQVQKLGSSPTIVWQSFDFPTNTLVEFQNFTSAMTLASSDGQYSMRLGNNFIGLYIEDSSQMYWKHTALEIKARIEEGLGPIHVRINPNGYLGMYQSGNTPVDVEAFSSFQRPVTGLLILRLESDGNLKGYLWDGSRWALNYQAISETCQLPNPCGPYSLCTPGSGCSCLDNSTQIGSSACTHSPPGPADLCGGETEQAEFRFKVMRRRGVEVPFKELWAHRTTSSWEQCEVLCAEDCKCWGAVYNNGSGFCYSVNYPTRTMLGVMDEGKIGYFKVWEGVEKKKRERVKSTVWILSLCGAAGLTVSMSYYGFRRRERRGTRILEGETGYPLIHLGSDNSHSIEMTCLMT